MRSNRRRTGTGRRTRPFMVKCSHLKELYQCDSQLAKDIANVIGKGHRVARSSGEQETNHLIRSSLEYCRTGVASFTKRCSAKTTDSNLIGESYVANFVR